MWLNGYFHVVRRHRRRPPRKRLRELSRQTAKPYTIYRMVGKFSRTIDVTNLSKGDVAFHRCDTAVRFNTTMRLFPSARNAYNEMANAIHSRTMHRMALCRDCIHVPSQRPLIQQTCHCCLPSVAVYRSAPTNRSHNQGTSPSLDLTFPPTGLSENLGGTERGRGGKGKGGGDHLPYFPPLASASNTTLATTVRGPLS